MEELEFFAPCSLGLEGVCADELRAMRMRRVRPLKSGVAFFGTLEQGMRAALWTRVASRVLLIIGRVPASDADELYRGVRGLPWTEWLDPLHTIAVDARGTSGTLRDSRFLALKVKDAACDALRDAHGVRPDVDPHDADVRINVSLHGAKATVALDLAGEALHRRGYRQGRMQVTAPLKETLAAGILLLAGWPRIAQEGGTFLDPLCGSGTFAIEAAMIAYDIAPGILRERWCFESWKGFDAGRWDALLDEADERAEQGRARECIIRASDIDPVAVGIARECLRRMRLDGLVELGCADVAELAAPESERGLIAMNPPYGERLSTRAQLPALYAAIASRLRRGFEGFSLAVISPDPGLDAALGLVPERTVRLYNGPIESLLHLYVLGPSSGSDPDDGRRDAPSGFEVVVGEQHIPVAMAGTGQFVSRLRKVARLRRRWARRERISAYRIYDADLPDYNLAIDWFGGAGPDKGRAWVQVAEYAAPSEVDPEKARARFADALAVIPAVLGVRPQDVFCKVRRHGRGGSQYACEPGGAAVTGITEEAGLLFKLNLSERLDCGLFLDQRLTRELIFGKAEGARFLNLFAYTGTATVHAAAGGARSTTTVDLSQNYLDWARENMELNGFSGGEHEYVRADCRRWVDEQRTARRRFDLIFVDPPTFSNSSKMGRRTFDVQRDHVELLIGVSRLLSRGGLAVFSCNLKRFTPDLDKLGRAGVKVVDITAETIPEDFSRSPRVHHAYLVTREASG
ncbi:MAG: bifunctional 23S rRNA (guanine(2069)-N(7))-methyltransferase RlmK/23S rRNA (guanine(2445)-N(2))-methyltransferase RlmL [Coriobacteriales bacterium]|nr:bifunctional 23S rRNA (guanine(2069)-N(7))-methyltransferase RlmK/23S rRNA (guanine(2445)-N(2))-methyltransferase RlmL [Coriobacteriales bacterium]